MLAKAAGLRWRMEGRDPLTTSRTGVVIEQTTNATLGGRHPAYCGWRTARYLYVEYDGRETAELYDYAKDPDELGNVAQDDRLRRPGRRAPTGRPRGLPARPAGLRLVARPGQGRWICTLTQVCRRQAGQRIHDPCPRLRNGRCSDGTASRSASRGRQLGVLTAVAAADRHHAVRRLFGQRVARAEERAASLVVVRRRTLRAPSTVSAPGGSG